jgi:hypothetical protein
MKTKTILISLFMVFTITANAINTAGEAFHNIKPQNKPWAIWYWMHGCVSKQGITLDLEAMKEAGLEGTYLMPIRGVLNPSPYNPAVETMSPEWWNLVRFAMQEAKRLDLKIGMHICDGFALAGGPWITPEMSMQKLVWTKEIIKGGKPLQLNLKQPETNYDFYKDIAVFAYPSLIEPAESQINPLRITSDNKAIMDLMFLVDKNNRKDTFRSDEPCSIVYEYDKPFTCRSIITETNGNSYQTHRLIVEAGDDGINYKFVAKLEPPRHGWQNTAYDVTHSIPPTKARFFRFKWTKEGSEPGAEDLDNAKWVPTLKMTGLFLCSEPVINQYEGKNASVWRLSKPTVNAQLPENVCIPKDKLINISQYVDQTGKLNWNAPAGNWTIIRIGHTTTGMTNATGGAGSGLECDKFSKEAVQLQYDSWFGRIFKEVGEDLASDVLKVMHMDSWECGSQNWSDSFAAEFQSRRGYSIMDYLPVMAGVPVVSAEFSENVLHDVRKTVAELINDKFFKTLAEAAHKKGCTYTGENVAPTMISDGMLHFGTVDVPMGEFWYESPTHDKPNDMMDAISGAHIYGKNIIMVEGFTQLRTIWNETPANHKALLDRYFAMGINKMAFHVYTHNPFIDRKPGTTLSGMGLFFQRDQTWWKPGKAWMDYVSRCQSLLQMGKPVVDIAIFNGLEVPSRSLLPDRIAPSLPGLFGNKRFIQSIEFKTNKGVPVTERPAGVTHVANIFDIGDWTDPLRGYKYDTFNPDVLFNALKTADGNLQLATGANYKLLVIPGKHPMSPVEKTYYKADETRLAEKIKALNNAGAKILLSDSLASAIGVKPGLPWIKQDLVSLGIARDFEAFENGIHTYKDIEWTHRATDSIDIYFISNQKNASRDLELTMRVSGRKPEIFNPVNGKISEPGAWMINGNKTNLSLKLEPYEALFVVFEKPAETDSYVAELSEKSVFDCPELINNWTVRFDTAFGGPEKPVAFEKLISWTEKPDTSVKYYSGTAIYSKDVTIKKVSTSKNRYTLKLGKIADLAEVIINGKNCGIAWTSPYEVDITDAIQKGVNHFEIKVTNTWSNRLELDAMLPESQRVTWTDGKYRKKTRELIDAGLHGPLTIESQAKITGKDISKDKFKYIIKSNLLNKPKAK